ncbi:phosphoenolpyruvate carboxylase [Tanacetum coccineum]
MKDEMSIIGEMMICTTHLGREKITRDERDYRSSRNDDRYRSRDDDRRRDRKRYSDAENDRKKTVKEMSRTAEKYLLMMLDIIRRGRVKIETVLRVGGALCHTMEVSDELRIHANLLYRTSNADVKHYIDYRLSQEILIILIILA